MSIRFDDDPDFSEIIPKPSPRRRYTLVKVGLVVAVIVFLISLFLPASRTARPAARRMQCSSNLRQIVLALNNYEQVYKTLPPAYTVDPDGSPMHSWRTLILPYMDEQALYESIDFSKPWNDPANAPALAKRPSLFRCPNLYDSPNQTAYLAIVGPGNFLDPGRPRRLEEITDGLSTVLAVIEVGQEAAVPWMAPTDANLALVLKLDPKANHLHSGGMNAAFVDGSVRFLRADLPAPIWRALLSISGNDDPAAMDW
ncbi:DUF1559 domain-containing protein [Tundrisphaera lichenicola]|uniref:DUF1559 domain-containing protein n=1 Tax=Tundrisphaera lichenicola TaxID=2029860 RepID=UPI003EBC0EDE